MGKQGATLGLVGMLALTVVVAGAALAAPPPDRTPPSTPTVDGEHATYDLQPAFHFLAHDDRTPPGQVRFLCAIDTPSLHPCSRISRPSAQLPLGAHVLRVRASDRAGNISKVASYPFTVIGRWDAAAEFAKPPNTPANPGRDRYGNTTWFYLYSGSVRHDPSDYHLLETFDALDPNFQIWRSGVGEFSYRGVWLGWSFGRITITPGVPNLGQNAVLGWRSPVTSTVKVHAVIWQNQNTCALPQNGILWSIDQGASTLRSGRLAPGETTTTDTTTIVAAGDALFLVIGDNGDSNCDGTFLDFSVETVPG